MPAPSPRTTRVIFVNRFYWPEEPATAQLLTDLAEELAKRGNEIVVVTRHPGRPAVPQREIRNGVHVVRIRSTNWHRAGLAGKTADYATFFVGAIFRLLTITRRGDALIALTDPPLLGTGAWLVARCRGARLFHWVQDVFPELAIELAGQRWLGMMRPLRDRAWRAAEQCVVLGQDMAAVLTLSRVPADRVSILANWAPAGLAPPPPGAHDALRVEWGLSGKFVVAYSGNLGRVHDLEPVLAVAEVLRDEPAIAFVFIGGGAQAAALTAEAQRRGLGNISFRPPQARTRLGETLALGDVHLVTLRPGCERYVFPSKLYGIAAVGRPVVFIGPRECELARVVEGRGFGHAFASAETAAIAAALRTLQSDPAARERCGLAAAKWSLAQGGLGAAASRWQSLVGAARELAGESPPV
jgi:colanic acid biosynthesis glycosyl transferase WcaI